MRKLLMYNMVSVDGFFARENGDIDWHTVDDTFNDYAIETLENIDTIIFGRVTYQIFEGYWPKALTDATTSPKDRVIAQHIDSARKVVFSKSLGSVEWKNSELHGEINSEEIVQLKAESGKNIIIYGSGTITQQLASLGLIDEYRLIVSPIILGRGVPLFKSAQQTRLKLIESRAFPSNGNVLLSYSLENAHNH